MDHDPFKNLMKTAKLLPRTDTLNANNLAFLDRDS